jgi:hypothetical protein
MAGYVDPLEPVAGSEFSPLEDAADHFLTPCRHPPAVATPSRHAVISWRRGRVLYAHGVLRTLVIQRSLRGCFGMVEGICTQILGGCL